MNRPRPSVGGRPPIHHTLGGQVYLITLVMVLLWLEEVVDLAIFGGALDRYGIHPRDTERWFGLLCAPFLHQGFKHLAANSIPLALLGWLVLVRGVKDCFLVSLGSALASGAIVWLFGDPSSVHIGASGVIFGYLGFLLARALVEHSVINLLIALVVAFLYGGLLWGVFPTTHGVSWEGHLGGLIGGALMAALLPIRKQE